MRQANVTLILKKNKRAEECPPAIPTNILIADSKVVSVIPAHGLDYLTVWIKGKILVQEKSVIIISLHATHLCHQSGQNGSRCFMINWEEDLISLIAIISEA